MLMVHLIALSDLMASATLIEQRGAFALARHRKSSDVQEEDRAQTLSIFICGKFFFPSN